ncbi:unnamed protein product [Gordionus sp. m RMFG-2023]|uniref:uncharacterized protein LOC135927991 n=1 Tax=Gordionus sp. m RMFG-2023 TaxID=3053472 RepID=UPI0030DED47B
MKAKISYGSWKSPITSDLIVTCTSRINEIQLDQNLTSKKIYWSESKNCEGGRNTINCYDYKTKELKEFTPKEFNVSSRVHEYGGNSFMVNNGDVYFVNKSDQRIYLQKGADKNPEPITLNQNARYTDFYYDNLNHILYCVCEKHCDDNLDPDNVLIALNPRKLNTNCNVIAQGSDFYLSPSLSSTSKYITWNQWNHPNMPWDSSEICVGNVHITKSKPDEEEDLEQANMSITSIIKLSIPGVSSMQPKIVSNNTLYYLSDRNGFYNLYKRSLININGSTEFGDESKPLVKFNGEHHKDVGYPLWNSGDSAYDISPTKPDLIVAIAENDMYLVKIRGDGDEEGDVVSELLLNGDQLGIGEIHDVKLARFEENVAFAIIRPKSDFEYLARIDLLTGKLTPIRKTYEGAPLDERFISKAEEITFPTFDGQTSFGYFYPPQNPDHPYSRDHELAPPMIVTSHGGPTAKKYDSLDLKGTQFFTSRGIAVFHVNYRGSFGRGKAYRDSLKGNWGILDVEDCCSAAIHMSRTLKRVNPNLLFINGSSSGGYTTLACLAFKPDIFKAGVARYGICDLEALIDDTHKFEKYYTQILVCGDVNHNESTGDGQKNLYKERSPINHIDRVKAPVAFIHGKEDKVVLPNQAIMMYEALIKKGIPASLTLFDGEGHGFKDPKNIKRALECELDFYNKIISDAKA